MNAGRLMTYGTLLHRPEETFEGGEKGQEKGRGIRHEFFSFIFRHNRHMHAPGKENVGDARDNETILREIKRERMETEGWPIVSAVTPYSLYRAATRVARCTVFVIGVHIELCNGTPYAQEDSFQPRQMKTAKSTIKE